MSSDHDKQQERKRLFYANKDVVRRYMWIRYSGSGGRNVFRRERANVVALLGKATGAGRALDLACGLGRAGPWLKPRYSVVIGADSSFEMLMRARKRYTWVVQCDIHRLPFRPGCFSFCLALRLFIHLPNPAPLAREVERVLADGGMWLLETYRWSLQAFAPSSVGGGNYHYSLADVGAFLKNASLTMSATRNEFILPPSLLRWLGPVAKLDELLSTRVSDRMKQTLYVLSKKEPGTSTEHIS